MTCLLDRPRTAVQRLYDGNPQAFAARLRAEAHTLFETGYRVEASGMFGVFAVQPPQGNVLLVDAYSGLCTCAFSKSHYLPCGCKHLIGLQGLVLAQTMDWQQAASLMRHWWEVQEKLLLQQFE